LVILEFNLKLKTLHPKVERKTISRYIFLTSFQNNSGGGISTSIFKKHGIGALSLEIWNMSSKTQRISGNPYVFVPIMPGYKLRKPQQSSEQRKQF
jgi:hypothetical protein